MIKHTSTGSVFDDLGFDEAEATNLKIRASLMRAIEKYISEHQLTQENVVQLMGVSQACVSDLMAGKIDQFTIDILVNMLAKAHVSIALVIDDKLAA